MDSVKKEIEALYQGEVIGEVLFNEMLPDAGDRDTYYKIATMLQLETETKAMLRPIASKLDIDIAESEEARQLGLDFARSVKGKSWQQAMAFICEAGEPYLRRYVAFAAVAPDEYKKIADAMVIHEQSLHDFFAAEAAGREGGYIEKIVAQLHHPLPRP